MPVPKKEDKKAKPPPPKEDDGGMDFGDSDDDSLGLTELENSIREVAEMEGIITVFFFYVRGI